MYTVVTQHACRFFAVYTSSNIFEHCDHGKMWKSNGRGSAGLNCMAQAFRLKYLFKLPEGTSSAESANARGSVNMRQLVLALLIAAAVGKSTSYN